MIQEKQLTKIPELDSFAMELKANGFTVIVTENPSTWITFFKNGHIGYVEKGYFSEYNFSTVHKPSAANGTGFRVLEMAELTIKNANCALEMPTWARNIDKILYYSTPEEFINARANQWAKYYIL